MKQETVGNWIIGMLVGGMLSLRSKNGGTNRHFTKPLGCVIALMVIGALGLGTSTFAGLIPANTTIKMPTSEISEPWICPPHLTRRTTMEKLDQPGEAQWKDVKKSAMELRDLDIDSIEISKYHPRLDYGDIEKLQGSLRRDGLKHPLAVYEIEPGRYGIEDGARRHKAAKGMGWKKILCLIKRGITEAEAAHSSYVINAERKTLSAIEEARHIQTMRDTFGYTYDELELKGYGSPTSISNKLKLLDLPEKVQGLIQESKLSAAHGRELVKLPTKEEQQRMAIKIVDHDLTVRVSGARIDRYLSKKRKEKKDRPKEIIPVGDIPGVYMKDARDMAELPDKCVHLIVTSPPYHVGMEFEAGETFKEHLANVGAVMKECARVLAPGGVIVLNVADIVNYKSDNGTNGKAHVQLMAHRYQAFLKRYGVLLTDEIIWKKRPVWNKDRYETYKANTPHTSYRIFDNWEPVYILHKKGERQVPSEEIALQSRLTREQWMTYINGVWEIEPNRSTHHGHPCTFPDELVNRLVRLFSFVGDTVLDPFLGSGTTVKVARELGREAIGYERELQYKAAIMRKLGLPFVDTLENVQQTLSANNWAPDLSGEDSSTEVTENQETEEALPLAAEVGAEA
ncbi:MAG: DNA methyltransferase [Pseudomonadota bacterium]